MVCPTGLTGERVIKKLLYICVFILCFASYAFATNFFVDASASGDDNGTSKVNAWESFDKINWSLLDDDDDSTVLFVCGEFRETLRVGASGESGQIITIKSCTVANGCGAEDPAVIKLTDDLHGNTWTNVSDGADGAGGFDIYRTTPPSGSDYSYGMLNEALDARLDRGDNHCDYGRPEYADFEEYEFFGGSKDDKFVYISSDSSPSSWALAEVGARLVGVYIYDKSYITIDGITIYGPGGETTGDEGDPVAPEDDNYKDGSRHRAKYRGGFYGFWGSDVIIKNCIARHFTGMAFFTKGSAPPNGITFQDCWADDAWGGFWSSYGEDSVNGPITISRCLVTDNSIRKGDCGDRDGMGFYNAQDVLIEDSYIDTTGVVGGDDKDLVDGGCILCAACEGIIVRRTKVKNCAYQGISIGGNEGPGNYGVQVYNNIIDTWGRVSGHPHVCEGCAGNGIDDAFNWYDGIRIGSGELATSNYGNTYIYNNLITNGPSGQDIDADPSGIKMNHYYYQGHVLVRNNMFLNNGTEWELIWSVNSATSKNFSFNYFDRESGKVAYDRVTNPRVIYSVGNNLADFNDNASFANDNYNQDDCSISNEAGDDPNLQTGTYAPQVNSPTCVKTGGYDLGTTNYDDAIDPARDWIYPFGAETVTRAVGVYEIGPVAFGGSDSDDDPPNLDPAEWSYEPAGILSTAMYMIATTTTDATEPISVYFDFDPNGDSCSAECGDDFGTGGTDSDWQVSEYTYMDSGLQANKCYCYKVKYRDAVTPTPNEGTLSAMAYGYTLVNAHVLTLSNETDSTFDITLSDVNPTVNPDTESNVRCMYAVPEDGDVVGKYVQSDGSMGAAADWQVRSVWNTVTITGLNGGTLYSFLSTARNEDGNTLVGSEPVGPGWATTLAPYVDTTPVGMIGGVMTGGKYE